MNEKQYFKILIFLNIFLILFVMSINYFIDPEQIFSSKNKFSKNYAFVERMINSKNYTYMEPGISIREVKKILARIPTKKKCAVFGSSHVMEIRSDTISKNFKDICPSLINLAVAGYSIEDLFIFSELLSNNSQSPKHIIIEITPWIFNFGRDTRWQKNKSLFYKMNSRIDSDNKNLELFKTKEPNYINLVKNLFNFDYFKVSLSVILSKINEKYNIDPLKDHYELDYFDNEGAIYRSKKMYDEKIKKQDLNYFKDNYKIEKNNWTQDLAISKFIKLLEILERRFDITFIMTPYHPDVFEFKNQPVLSAIDIVEKKALEIGKIKNIKILGSFYPDSSNCNRNEFWNSNHAQVSCLKKLDLRN